MKSMDTVGVTFVNTVLGRGVLNNVINIQLGTLLFSPGDGETQVDPDLVVSARLRMDRACAKQLHETLGQLLEMIAEQEAAPGELN